MRTTLLSLLCVSLLFTSIAELSAQTKKRSATTRSTSKTTQGITSAGANQIIKFNNSINSFFKTYFNIDHTAEFYSFVNIAQAQRGKRTKTTVYDTYRDQNSFDISVERFNGYAASSDLVDPINPPAVIGAANIAFFKAKWTELKAAYETCAEKHNTIMDYLDSSLELRKKSDEQSLKSNLEEYKALVVNLYKIQDEISEKVYELGDMAEEVTLAKHPMRNEILDLRKTLRIVQSANNNMQKCNSAEDLESQLANFATAETQLKVYIDKYANYDSNVGATPQIKYMKAAVESFYKNTARFNDDLLNVPATYKNDWELNKRKLQAAYDLIIIDYKSFIQRNNNY